LVTSKHWLALIALGVVWGTSWVAADTLAEYVPPLHGAAARFLLAALLCFPVILGKRLQVPRGRALGFVLLLSATMIVVPFVLLLWAQQHASSAIVTALYAAMPLLVAVWTPRRVPRGALLATVIGLGAITLVIGVPFSVAYVGGAAVSFLAAASAGASALLARRELRSVNPVMAAALLLGAAAVLLFLAGAVLERGQPVEWNRRAIVALLFLAMVSGALGYAIYLWLLQQLEAYKVVTVQWIQPLAAMLETAVFLRVGLSFSMIAGSLVTVASLLMVMRATAEDDDTVSLLGN
jgi:drug/metabolite transporter (DMT)-like permease